MLALLPENNYQADIMMFGGQDTRAPYGTRSQTASRESLRLTINNTVGGNYTFQGGWVQEIMGGPRVMPDVVILPNGIVIMLNGAYQGYAGGAVTNAVSF